MEQASGAPQWRATKIQGTRPGDWFARPSVVERGDRFTRGKGTVHTDGRSLGNDVAPDDEPEDRDEYYLSAQEIAETLNRPLVEVVAALNATGRRTCDMRGKPIVYSKRIVAHVGKILGVAYATNAVRKHEIKVRNVAEYYAPEPPPDPHVSDEPDAETVEAAIREARGSIRGAAAILHMHTDAVRELVDEYGIECFKIKRSGYV